MSHTDNFDVDAEYEKLLADAGLNDEKANLNWLKMTTQEDHAKEVKRLTELQKKNAEKLHKLNKQASKMLAKHKAEEANEANEAEELTDDEFNKLLDEYSKGGKTRRHKMRGYKKKRTHKKKRTYRKKSMNKKKRANRTTHRRRH